MLNGRGKKKNINKVIWGIEAWQTWREKSHGERERENNYFFITSKEERGKNVKSINLWQSLCLKTTKTLCTLRPASATTESTCGTATKTITATAAFFLIPSFLSREKVPVLPSRLIGKVSRYIVSTSCAWIDILEYSYQKE